MSPSSLWCLGTGSLDEQREASALTDFLCGAGDIITEELYPGDAGQKDRLPGATRALLGKTVVESRDEGSPGNQIGLDEGRREGAAREMRLGILPFELGSFDPSIDECSTLTPSSAAMNNVPDWLTETLEERRQGSMMKGPEDAKTAHGTSKTSFFGGRGFNISRKSKNKLASKDSGDAKLGSLIEYDAKLGSLCEHLVLTIIVSMLTITPVDGGDN